MEDTEGSKPVAEGFSRHFRRSNFTNPWEPLYSRVTDTQVHIGTILKDSHCNSRGLVHGAFLAALADNAIGLSCGIALRNGGRSQSGLVTVHLSVDYVGMAKVGDWINTDTTVIKTGAQLCVANTVIVADRGPIARANATFQLVPS